MSDNSKLVLKPISSRISNFVFRKYNTENDLFLCAKKDDENQYSSKKISYENLINSYINFLKIMTNKQNFFLDNSEEFFNPSGKWSFSKGGIFFTNNIKLSSFLSTSFDSEKENGNLFSSKFPGYVNYELDETLDENGNTPYDNLKYTVVNHRFVKEELLNELTKLSSQYFGTFDKNGTWKQLLPSYVGMVILNNNLSSLELVQEIYGTSTKWERIEGRFLLGSGSVSESNTTDYFGKCSSGSFRTNSGDMGGQYKILPEELDLAKHSHAFNKGPGSKNEIPNFGKFPLYFIPKEKVKFGTEDRHTVYYPDPVSGFGCDFEGDLPDDYKSYLMSNKTVNLELQTFGSSRGTPKGNFTAELEIGDFVNGDNKYNQPHSNMHPYYSTYIWERIS